MSKIMNPGQRQGLLDQVAKGLSIARDIYGIKADIDKSREDQQAKEDEAKGIVSPGQVAELGKTHDFSDKPLAGAVKLMQRNADGSETPLFAVARQKTEKTPLQKVTVKEGGKKVEKWIRPEEGQSFEAWVDPKEPKEDKTPGNTMDLRKEYNSHPVTKATSTMASAFNKIQQTASKTDGSGAGDISLVYSFMKMNDPESAVREGEYATAENSGGIEPRIRNIYNKILNGERLAPEQRKAFADQAATLMAAQLESQAEQDQRYTDLATRFNLDPRYVVDQTFANIQKKLQQAPAPTPPPQGAGEAYASPTDGQALPSAADIEAELERRAKAGDPVLKGAAQKGGFGK